MAKISIEIVFSLVFDKLVASFHLILFNSEIYFWAFHTSFYAENQINLIFTIKKILESIILIYKLKTSFYLSTSFD